MVKYLCGWPNCGKSLLAEQALARLGRRILYVGTLPNIQAYELVIQLHQVRRPDAWELYECSGDPIEDIQWLTDAMDQFDGILIDGIAFYIQRAQNYYPIGKYELEQVCKFLKKAAEAPLLLYIVDQPLNRASPAVRASGRLLHSVIYRNSNSLSFVSAGVSYPCTPGFLRALDKGVCGNRKWINKDN